MGLIERRTLVKMALKSEKKIGPDSSEIGIMLNEISGRLRVVVGSLPKGN